MALGSTSETGGSGWVRESGYNQIFEKQGNRFAIATESLKHNLGWQVWQGFQAIVLSIANVVTGLSVPTLRSKSSEKWDKALSGKEKHYIVERLPPSSKISTTEKVQIASAAILFPLDERQMQKLEALLFIDNFRNKTISRDALESQFMSALNAQSLITQPEDRKTLMEAGEEVARRFAVLERYSDARAIRITTAERLLGEIPHEKINILAFIDKVRFQPSQVNPIELISTFPRALKIAKEFTDPFDRIVLLQVADTIARDYVKHGQFDKATEIRIEAAQAFSDTPSINDIKIDGFIEQYRSSNFDSLYESGPLKDLPKEHLKALIEKMIGLATDETYREDLVGIAAEIADKYDQAKEFKTATEIRKNAAQALSMDITQEELEEVEFLSRLTYDPETISRDELEARWKQLQSSALDADNADERWPVLTAAEILIDQYLEKNEVEKALNIFAEAARAYLTDPKTIESEDLETIYETFQEALKIAPRLLDAEGKTTFLAVAEFIAGECVKAKDLKRAIAIRIQAAQSIEPSPPLADLTTRWAKEHPKLGLKIYPIDTSLFKNHTLSMQRQKFSDGTQRVHAEAKLSHPAREKLQETLDLIQSKPSKLHKGLPVGFCSAIRIEEKESFYRGRADKSGKKFEGDFSNLKKDGFAVYDTQSGVAAMNTVIYFEGVGNIKIGSSAPLFRALYNRISIDLEPHIKEEEAVEKITIMLAALGLEAALSSPRNEDEERIKIMQLFRIYYPQQAYGIERDEKRLNQPIESLKKDIESIVPDMKMKFKHYLVDHPDLMYKQEVYAGQPVWAVRGVAKEVKKQGGMGLMAGINGWHTDPKNPDPKDVFQNAARSFASMLKLGALSSHDRFEHGIIIKGDSSATDLRTGGAEYVFTRLITTNMPKNPSYYPLNGQFQILYDLDLVERGGMAYTGDSYGTKEPSTYQYRPSIIELAGILSSGSSGAFLGNEVCIRNRASPQFMKGVMVESQEQKQDMIDVLRAEGLIALNASGEECINGIQIDNFIHIGEFKAEYWA